MRQLWAVLRHCTHGCLFHALFKLRACDSAATSRNAVYPYLVLWQPLRDDDIVAPPRPEELQAGAGGFVMRALESKWLPALNLASTVGLFVYAATAGADAWNGYFQFFDESKFIHVMSIDFLCLTALQPFFLWYVLLLDPCVQCITLQGMGVA